MSFLSLFLCFLSVNAQLTNSRWIGEINSTHPKSVIFDFKTDTVSVFILPDTVLLETLSFKIENNILLIKKISGSSPCDVTMIGKYNYEMKADEMVLTLVDDPCPARAGLINKESYVQLK